jgi:phosphoglycolate phosphatase
MKTIQGLIFDLDGTLADTLRTIAGAVNHSLEGMQLPVHPLEAYQTLVGDGIVKLCERALPDDQQGRLQDLLVAVRRRYETHMLEGADLYPGIAELLAELRQRDKRMAVLSNKPHALTLGTVEGLDIAPYFEVVLGQRDDLPRKPDPAGVHFILEQMNLTTDEVLYVGDTPTDMQTAKAAGLRAAAVLWGFRSREELEAQGADFLIAEARELLGIPGVNDRE